MGLSESLRGNRAYFDANIFIYLLEPPSHLRRALSELLALIAAGQVLGVTSEPSLCEVLTKPFRNNDQEAIRLCHSLIEESGAFELAATSRSIYLIAARLRAEPGLKTPDAIHVATAVESKCSLFLSNDARLKLPASIGRIDLHNTSSGRRARPDLATLCFGLTHPSHHRRKGTAAWLTRSIRSTARSPARSS